MNHNKIINKMNIKEANNMDTTEELGDLISLYYDKLEEQHIESPTAEDIQKEENELVFNLLGESLSPFYIEFCNQILKMIDIIHVKIKKSWENLNNSPENLEIATELERNVTDLDTISAILSKRIEDFHGVDEYIEQDSPINNYLTGVNNNYLKFTNRKEHLKELQNQITYCDLFIDELHHNLLDFDYKFYGNLYHFCQMVFCASYSSELYLRTLKKELGIS